MMKRIFSVLLALITILAGVDAQVTTTPSPLTEDATDVVVFFHADQGNKGLANQPASAQIYAHTGVVTSSSSSEDDWKYAPTWGDNSLKYKLEYVSPNLWKLNIGNLRAYYNVAASETIKKLCFVFRNSNGSKEGKAAGNKNIMVDVADKGLQISLQSSVEGKLIFPGSNKVKFTAGCTENCSLAILVNGKTIAESSSTRSLEADYTFTEYGNFEVMARAVTASGEKKEQTLSYAYLPSSSAAPYPGGDPRQGAVRDTDGSVTFCLAAPGKNSVFLVGSWNDYLPVETQVMKYTDVEGQRYFWTTVEGLDAETMYPYYYVVDYSINVADPYARLVLDPWNDKFISKEVFPGLPDFPFEKVPETTLAVYQENINDFNWRYSSEFKRASNSDLLIYELLFRDFTGTEGKAEGNGTVKQAISRIPYLKRLGVNAVEVLPITEFNGNISWGYNPNFYFSPDKAYGTPSDYKEFIDACHEAGIAVILDVVFNQSDWQHPWYQMYEVGANPFYNASAPHAYSVLNDWNQGHPLVQQQWKDMMCYWLEEYKVDGFRFDLVKGLGDNDSYANSGEAATNAYNASRVSRMRELQLAARQVRPDVIFINEDLAGEKEENEMAQYGQLNWSNWNNGACQFAMGYQSDSSLAGLYAPKAPRTWGSTVSYLESHDEQRLAYKQNKWGYATVMTDKKTAMRRLGSAAAQMIMAPGAHMIWQFSELGDAQNAKDQNGGNDTDPKKVVWEYLDDPDRVALHDSYMEMLWLRRNNPALFAEDAVFTSSCTASDWTSGRIMMSKTGNQELFTLINPNVNGGNITFKVDFSQKDDSAYCIFSKSSGSEPTFSAVAGTVSVPANCYVVIGTRSIVGVDEVSREENSKFIVNVDAGKITVSCAAGPVRIYSADGVLCAVSTEESKEITLPSGIYIVTDGKENKKIFVW